ncbi:MAG: ABC transporter permease [Actinobacteria bacterium]|nr:ABC transporter permease [Actinomycetota bacterium]
MFLALRDLRRGWRRFALVGLVVGLVAMLSTVLTGLADGLVRDGTSGLRALPITHLAFAPHSEAVFSRSTLGERALRRWRAVPGVEATPLGVSFVNAEPVGNGRSIDLALFGLRDDSYLARASEGAAGLDGLVLSSELRDEGAHLGGRYRIGGPAEVALRVQGFTFAGSYGHVPIAYVPLSTWQRIAYGSPGGRFSAIALRLPPGVDVAAVDRAAGTETKTKEQAYGGSPGFTAETATMTLIRAFLLLISALVVGAFFTVLTVQRTQQIGLLKALGASSWFVLRDGVGQLAVVVVAATALGAAGGTAVVAALDGGPVPVALLPGDILAGSALLVAAGVGAGFVCFRRITRVEPAISLEARP